MNGLTIENLTVSYKEKKSINAARNNKVLNNFLLEVKNGELIVLLGPSGCGKSTLLTALSGLKKPDSGRIVFGSETFFDDKTNVNIPAEDRNIGFVFQSYALWPHMTVFQNIAFPLKARKYSKERIKKRVDEVLDVVHMSEYTDRYPDELSGGERQRIALARSLVYEPSLLLLDEPLANLDANLKTSLISEIKEIQRKLNITTIYVTHDQQEAFEIADKIVIMNEGDIMQQGTPKEIYSHSDNRFVAEFIGKNNFFSTKDSFCPRGLKECCKKKTISIRPEDIVIDSDGEHQGVIKRIFYKGNHTEYIAAYKGNRLIIHDSGDADYHVEDNISFTIKKYHSF